MNLDDAISAHSKWKMKLASYISKPDKNLQASVVGADNQCDLGKWLYGEGQQYSRLPEYSKLVSDHSEFHKLAAEIVRNANSGQKVVDEIALGSKSKFASVSSAIVLSLKAMKSKI